MASTNDAPAAIPIAREPERMEHLIKCNKLLEEVRVCLCCLFVFVCVVRVHEHKLNRCNVVYTYDL